MHFGFDITVTEMTNCQYFKWGENYLIIKPFLATILVVTAQFQPKDKVGVTT